MNSTRTSPETLGAFLARIRPGDSCACCGAALRPLDPGPRKGSGSASRTGVASTTALVCPECGCEITEESGPDSEVDQRRLCPAA